MTTPRLEYVADGTHDGIRWHVQRMDGALLVTLTGFVGSAYLFNQVKVAAASPADVRRMVADEIAAVTRRSSKLAAREAVL